MTPPFSLLISSDMADSARRLQAGLERIRQTSVFNNAPFYILEDLRDIVTKNIVIDMTARYIHDHLHEDAVQNVLQDGVRLFAILAIMDRVDLLSDFLVHNTLDNSLPLRDLAAMQRIAPDLDTRFYSKFQWQFFPWSFKHESNSQHRILPDDTIIPFVSEKIIGGGASSKISVVEIPFQLQSFEGDPVTTRLPLHPCRTSLISDQDDSTVTIAQKRIKLPSGGSDNTSDGERECLRLYRGLQHPSIIPLLGSFTTDGHSSLLFPRYDMDLDAFLDQNRKGAFLDDTTFLAAIMDLASAIQTVHEVKIRSQVRPMYLTRFGYHHDIRPANILISEDKFILADFGLAYPKPHTTDAPPITTWDENIGHYIAPECMDEGMVPQKVGRSYDIWAFGCLLADLATFMEWGRDGVERFRRARETETYHDLPWGNGYFFERVVSSGQVRLKVQVSDWFQSLIDTCKNSTTRSLAEVSRQMLDPDPSSRPTMSESQAQLRFIYAKHLFQVAVSDIDKVFSSTNSTRTPVSEITKRELRLELCKLKAVGDILHLSDASQLSHPYFAKAGYPEFVAERLQEMSTKIKESCAILSDFAPVWTTSNSSNEMVKERRPMNHIDECVRKSIRELLESLPNQDSFDHFFLSHMQLLSNEPAHINISSTEPSGISMHQKFQQLNEGLGQKLHASSINHLWLELGHFDSWTPYSRYHHLARFHGGKAPSDDHPRVLIEWIFFSQFPEAEVRESRSQRLFDLAQLLHLPKPKEFLALDCIGFLPPTKESMDAYGFVYSFPRVGTNGLIQPITLRQLLNKKLRDSLFTLDDKFSIAKALSSSLCELHRHDWLHQNIRSENILFFTDDVESGKGGAKQLRIVAGPYLIGFHHGRKDQQHLLSDLPSASRDPEAVLYEHPEYERGKTRFEKDYDRYSLGVVLLEIAYWLPVQEMRNREKGMVGSQFRLQLLKKYVSKVAETMGSSYMKATDACMRGEFESRGVQKGLGDVSQFSAEVVQLLEACFVG